MIIPPGMQHKVNIYDDSMMINIVVNKYTFEKTFLGDIPQQSLLHQFFSEVLFSQESNAYVVFSGGNDEVLRDKLLDLMVAYLNETTYGARICDHYLSIFFLELLGQCKNVKLSSRLGKEGEQMTQILLYINHNYASISLEEVAEEFHYIKINRHSPYLSITLHKCYPYYLFGISAFPNSAYHTTARRKFSITIV